jgi:hypothetical protein
MFDTLLDWCTLLDGEFYEIEMRGDESTKERASTCSCLGSYPYDQRWEAPTLEICPQSFG